MLAAKRPCFFDQAARFTLVRYLVTPISLPQIRTADATALPYANAQ